MSLQETITQDSIQAFKSKEELSSSVLKLLKSAIQNKEIEKKEKLKHDKIAWKDAKKVWKEEQEIDLNELNSDMTSNPNHKKKDLGKK